MPAIEAPQSICWWHMNESAPLFLDPRGAGNMIVLVDSSKGVGIQFGFRAQGYNTRGFDGWNWGGKTLLEANHPALNVWHFSVYTFDGVTHRLLAILRKRVQAVAPFQEVNPAQVALRRVTVRLASRYSSGRGVDSTRLADGSCSAAFPLQMAARLSYLARRVSR